MAARQETLDKYSLILRELLTKTSPFNVEDAMEYHKVDRKLGGYLKKRNVLVQTGNPSDKLFITNYSAALIPQIVSDMIQERVNHDAEKRREEQIIANYRAGHLVDKNTLVNVAESERLAIASHTRESLITEVTEYAALAVKLGKTDVAGFITTMLKTK